MHFSRSLAGVALLGVFAAMAFAGAATGAPAQTETLSAVSDVTLTGTKMSLEKMGTALMRPVAPKALEKNPYLAPKAVPRQGGPARLQDEPWRTEGQEAGGAVVQGAGGRKCRSCCNC